ncbi:MAG: hemerythrin domain-containing protein [Salinibacter sp.]
MTKADQFTTTFREEHREIRDVLLELVQVFTDREPARARSLLEQAAALTGPHFRYEEESLYPALVAIFGEAYIEQLREDHDRAIGTAQALVELAEQEQLTEEEAARAVRWVQRLLPHVSDCDGLSIMVERLPEEQVEAIFAARERSRRADLDLLRWAEEVRDRPAVVPE